MNDDEINNLLIWTKEIYGMLKVELSLVGFWENTPSVNRLRGEISNFIASECSNIPLAFKNRVTIANEILSWAKDERITSAIIYAED